MQRQGLCVPCDRKRQEVQIVCHGVCCDLRCAEGGDHAHHQNASGLEQAVLKGGRDADAKNALCHLCIQPGGLGHRDGIALLMITVVGRCIGARDDEQAVYYTRKLTVWSYIAMGLSNGAILLFLHKLIGIYALSGETMVLSELLVRIHAGFAILLWTLSFVLPNALRAANDVKFTMIVSILSMAVWRLGFSYLLCVRMGWGAVGVWIAMIIDWVCRVTCFVLRFRSGVWKTKYQA